MADEGVNGQLCLVLFFREVFEKEIGRNESNNQREFIENRAK